MRRPAWPAQHWPLVILLVLTLIAAALRFWRLDVLPPGLFYDEAFNGLDARRLLSGEGMPVYFPANNGREPLYIYLQAISVFLFGPTAYALRFVSALIGVITVVAVYDLARSMLAAPLDDKTKTALSRWIALIAVAGLAVSFWHLSLSRLAFRAILLPLFSSIAFAAFWRGWRNGSQRAFVWAGVALGMAAYTYTAARLLPLVLLAFVMVEVVIDAVRLRATRQLLIERYRPRLLGLIWMTLAALLLVLPLLWTFATQPWLLSGRTEQVSIFTLAQADMPGTAFERFVYNVQVTLRSFYDTGDLNVRHNLPGRSVNDAILALLFSAGLLVAIWGSLRAARYRFLLIWLAVMLTPTIFSNLAPHALRSAGALPPLALLYGVGAGWILQTARSTTVLHRAGTALLLLVVLGSGSITAYDYFVRWAGAAQLGAAFDLDRYLAAEMVADWRSDVEDTDALLLDQTLYQTPQMHFVIGALPRQDDPHAATLLDAERVRKVTAMPGSDDQADFLLYKQDGMAMSSWREPLKTDDAASATAEPAQTIHWPRTDPEWPVLMQAPLADSGPALPAPRRIAHPLSVTFENGMKLVGYEVTPGTVPWYAGQGYRLTTFWQRSADTNPATLDAQAFNAFVHLYQNGILAQANGPLGNHLSASLWTPDFPISLWAPNEVVESLHFLPIPAHASAGKAYFEIGLYRVDAADEARIGIVDGAGTVSAKQVDFGAVMIDAAPPQAQTDDLCPIAVHFDDEIALLGVRTTISPAQPQQLNVTLAWRALDRPHTDVTAFVHLLDATDGIMAQHDQPPGGVDNPTSLWVPGETVRTEFSLSLPNTGRADRLRIGLYEPVSGRQLPTATPSTPAQFNMQLTAGDTYLLLPVEPVESGALCP